jgi:hypothetical protein
MMRLGWKGLAGFGSLCKVFAFSVVLTLALASAAFADEVTNRIDNSPDVALENITLNEGATQTVAFTVTVQGNDGDSGCNIDSGEQLTVEVSSSDTSVPTVSPQLDFSHLGVKGIGTLLTPLHQKPKSRCLLPIDYYDATFGPSRHFSQNTSSNTSRFFSRRLFAGRLRRPRR